MYTDRQLEIIETALKLIDSKGIQGLTLKNLAKKIGITEPAIYRHFDNKINILTAILDIFEQQSAALFSNNKNIQSNTLQKIQHIFEHHFQAFQQKPSLTAVIFSEEIFQNEPVLTEKIQKIIANNSQILTTVIFEGQKKQEIRTDITASDLAVMILGTLRLFVKKWRLSNYSFHLQQEGQHIINMIKLLISEKS